MAVDETSNMDGKVLSNAVFRLPMNESGKIRLQTSYNNERVTSGRFATAGHIYH
jgi:hypothetical protein